MTRRINLTRSATTVISNTNYGTYRLRVDAVAIGPDLDSNIFVYRHNPPSPYTELSTDIFEAVAGPPQLANIPAGVPNPDLSWPYFRLSYIELDVASTAEADSIWAEIQAEAEELLGALDRLELLEVNQTVWFPSAPPCIDGWSLTNFTGTTFRNGNPIPQITDQTAWNAATGPGWCYYNNDPLNNAIYGKLYNWFAVTDVRGLAPVGFHVPTLAEWVTLVTCLGGSNAGGGVWTVAGAKMKTIGTLANNDGLWNSPNVATNESGFSGLPAGCRTGSFILQHARGSFWVYDQTTCVNLNNGASSVYIGGDSSTVGYSVRLKQGAPPTP
jgi:uncharacterized protein (TIGR02145 family)